ncbi:MAG: hypothetical protein LQ343_001506 [Gyalolechia ehrenbergii]|nr:MAG: hypothetical protein LQ343_001506 [Gyalolechia ehrenbergii]
MPPLSAHIENAIGSYVLHSLRGRDAKLFTKSAAFATISATLDVTSSECGVSGSSLHVAHTPLAENRFPELSWQQPPATANENGPAIKEYVVVVEDPDAPLPNPVVHGLYYAIPGSKTALSPRDFEVGQGAKGYLHGGFRYGLNRPKCVWSGARPVLGHGVHRYFFQVVGLSKSLELGDREVVTKKVLQDKVDGKVVAWGVWVGTFERKFGLHGE